jgi:hypothetical protein
LRGAAGGGWERRPAVVVERGSSERSIEKVNIKQLFMLKRERGEVAGGLTAFFLIAGSMTASHV